MNFILDTHVLIWYLEGSAQLRKNTVKQIEDVNNEIFLSIASLWEMSIKIKLDKLKLSIDFAELKKFLTQYDIQILPITFEDTLTNLKLEFHHRDPFDRIIIAQAINNDFPIITNDVIFEQYESEVIW